MEGNRRLEPTHPAHPASTPGISTAWYYFDVLAIEQENRRTVHRTQCRLCQARIKAKSITDLKSHMRTHEKEYDEINERDANVRIIRRRSNPAGAQFRRSIYLRGIDEPEPLESSEMDNSPPQFQFHRRSGTVSSEDISSRRRRIESPTGLGTSTATSTPMYPPRSASDPPLGRVLQLELTDELAIPFTGQTTSNTRNADNEVPNAAENVTDQTAAAEVDNVANNDVVTADVQTANNVATTTDVGTVNNVVANGNENANPTATTILIKVEVPDLVPTDDISDSETVLHNDANTVVTEECDYDSESS